MRPLSACLCLAGVLALSGVVLTGCGSSDGAAGPRHSLEDVLAAVDGLDGAERTKMLEQLAADEGGGITFYTSSDLDYMGDVADAFEDAHDIDVSLYKASSDALVQRMIEEQRADFQGSDVVESNTPSLVPLVDEGILAHYESPKAEGLVAGSLDEWWIADKFNTFIVAWNTDRVPEARQPRSYDDLADPSWKGKLALEVDDVDWYKTLWEHFVETGKTPAGADRLFSAIAENATFVNGHNLMTQLVASGEFDATPDAYLHTVESLIDEDAPITWEPAVEPLISRPDGIGVVRETRHPAAALLLVDFVLDQGQEIFAEAGLTAARKDLGPPTSIPQAAMDVEDYVAHADEWSQRYENLVRLGTAASDGG